MKYAVVYEETPHNWAAYVPDLPGCVATGRTRAEVQRRIREAIGLHVEAMRSRGERVPETSGRVDVVDIRDANTSGPGELSAGAGTRGTRGTRGPRWRGGRPGDHRVLLENDRVRVVETTIPVGDITPVHTHLAPAAAYVISGSHFIRRDPSGQVLFDTRKTDPPFEWPRVLWSESNPAHTLENTGDHDLVVISVELRGAP